MNRPCRECGHGHTRKYGLPLRGKTFRCGLDRQLRGRKPMHTRYSAYPRTNTANQFIRRHARWGDYQDFLMSEPLQKLRGRAQTLIN